VPLGVRQVPEDDVQAEAVGQRVPLPAAVALREAIDTTALASGTRASLKRLRALAAGPAERAAQLGCLSGDRARHSHGNPKRKRGR
jgi:hypothetical protein